MDGLYTKYVSPCLYWSIVTAVQAGIHTMCHFVSIFIHHLQDSQTSTETGPTKDEDLDVDDGDDENHVLDETTSQGSTSESDMSEVEREDGSCDIDDASGQPEEEDEEDKEDDTDSEISDNETEDLGKVGSLY